MKDQRDPAFHPKPAGLPPRKAGAGPGIDAEDSADSAAAKETIGLMKAEEHPGEVSPPPRPVPGKPNKAG